jgi:hypothetical protein
VGRGLSEDVLVLGGQLQTNGNGLHVIGGGRR